jgi:peptidoglycan biosynthesis protein MviN/MurJ (putative lipid II flippase)
VAALATAHIVGIGRVRVILTANALAAVVDLSAALALVPLLDATGAALANSAAQVTYALVLAGVSARILGTADWRLTTVLPSLVAAGVACAAGWIVEAELGGLPGFLAGGAVLVVVYLAAALALGLLAADDARWLEAAVGGRLGRRVGRLTALVTIRWERS